TERQPLHRDVARGLVDSPAERILGLERSLFRGHQTQHHGLAGWDEAQRLERAGSIAVVLQEKAIDRQLVEELLGDGVVTALGEPAALRVAPANVESERHALASQALQRSSIGFDRLPGGGIGIDSLAEEAVAESLV